MDGILGMKLANLSICGSLGWSEEKIKEYLNDIMRFWHHQIEQLNKGKPYCLMISSAIRDNYDTDLSVPNMETLMMGETNTFLVHNLIRLFKKAKVTTGGGAFWRSNFFQNTKSLDDKVRIISNGRGAVALRE